MTGFRPDARTLAMLRREAEEARMARVAHKARWLNRAAVGFCMILALDWALPLQQFPNEPVLEQRPVSIPATLSNPQLAYRILTPHTSFRVHSRQAFRVLNARTVTVWRTPLLQVVRLVKAPSVAAGREPFAPYGGGVYTPFLALFPILLLLVASLGLLLPFSPETRLNTSVVSGLLWIITGVIMLLY